MVTLHALFLMYQKTFFQQESQMNQNLVKVAKELAEACTKGTKSKVDKVHARMVEAMKSLALMS